MTRCVDKRGAEVEVTIQEPVAIDIAEADEIDYGGSAERELKRLLVCALVDKIDREINTE